MLAAASCGAIAQNSWSLNSAGHYDGRGLRIINAYFNSQLVASDLSTPLVRVQYTGGHGRIKDDLSDAVFNSVQGCVKTNLGSTGFKVTTQYVFGEWAACGTYKYDDTYEFYSSNGTFYHYVTAHGPGYSCSDTVSWYGPEFRHDMDVTTSSPNSVDEWTGSWTNRSTEGNYYYQSPYLSPNYDWRNYVTGKQLTLAPAFISSGPDNYALRYNGSQFDAGGAPPLSTWSNGESIGSADIVNWLLPYGYATPTQCQTSYPCKIGMYTLINGY